MESHLYSVVTLRSLRDSVRNDWYIAKEYHIQPSEVKKLPYYQYEWLIEDIIADQKKAEEQQKRQQAENKMPNMSKVMNNYKSSIPKVSVPKMR